MKTIMATTLDDDDASAGTSNSSSSDYLNDDISNVGERWSLPEPSSIPQNDLKHCPPTYLLTNKWAKVCDGTKQFLQALKDADMCLGHKEVFDNEEREKEEEE